MAFILPTSPLTALRTTPSETRSHNKLTPLRHHPHFKQLRRHQPLRTPMLATAATTPATNSATTSTNTPMPLNDRLLIIVDDEASASASGILIAKISDENRERPSTGTVVGVAPGRYSAEGIHESLDFFKPGDKVMWKDDFGSETLREADGQEYLVLRAFSIIAKY